MGKVPVRLKEVVYTLSPFQQSVMSGLWKDMPHKTAHYMSKVRKKSRNVRLYELVRLSTHLPPYAHPKKSNPACNVYNMYLIDYILCRLVRLQPGSDFHSTGLCTTAKTTKKRRSRSIVSNCFTQGLEI